MRSISAVVAVLLATPASAAGLLAPKLHPDLINLGPPRSSWDRRSELVLQNACVADVCQPRVAIPGREQKFSMSGRRTELALTYLDRLHLEPFATVAWWLVASGVRLDYSLDQSSDPTHGKAARPRFQALLRWHLDALNRPVIPARHHG